MMVRLDHLVMTVSDLDATVAFYEPLGFTSHRFGEGRWALLFEGGKINLHIAGNEFQPCAARPTPGALDLCFLTTVPVEELGKWYQLVEGPVERSGAHGPLRSIYLRDPDGNLIELSNLITSR